MMPLSSSDFDSLTLNTDILNITSRRPINFIGEFHVSVLIRVWRKFQHLCEKALFADFA